MGVLAADMSLHVSDFHAAERTFQLLTQAVGRAGRGKEKGEAIIQTYDPKHYAIMTAKEQDYEDFYEQEIMYRELLFYPPVWNLLVILCTSDQEESVDFYTQTLSDFLQEGRQKGVQIVGPADATVTKINDVYRKVIYIKAKEYQTLVNIKDQVEEWNKRQKNNKNVNIQFDFNPMSGF